eukprot:GILJ01012238.1.p1 GENE.GILJ01012238.1~~GILJ01012238.1.p1  ORF type:complete len:179 (-),score=15.31 GILJ01012238.1:43-507(-)
MDRFLKRRRTSSLSIEEEDTPAPRKYLTQVQIRDLKKVVIFNESPFHASETEIERLKSVLNDEKETATEEIVLDALRRLSSMNITLPCLQQTKVGIVVNDVRKRNKDKREVFILAKTLLSKWKAVAEAAQSSKPIVARKKKLKQQQLVLRSTSN